jgi:hypothetical protein
LISPLLSLPPSPTIIPFQRLGRKQGKERARRKEKEERTEEERKLSNLTERCKFW